MIWKISNQVQSKEVQSLRRLMKKEVLNPQLEMFMNPKVLLKDTGKLQGYKEIDNQELIGKGKDRGKQREQNIRTKIKEMRENQ